jgi:histidinol-phosphate/aromatic aminotransferase/cobyric acid decarboxylase-like protein
VLDDVAEFEDRMRKVRGGRGFLAHELSKVSGLRAESTDGNFVLVDMHDTGIAPDAFVASVFAQGVLIRLLAVHHADHNYVRVTVGDDEQNCRCVEAMRWTALHLSPRESSVAAIHVMAQAG